jgi:arylsulfatase A-like enzyme
MNKPNIIFIFADQMRAHVLGCYGNQCVPTPNFDAMAQAGARFENAISTFPVCSPYRAMLLTGLHPMHNGTVNNDTGFKDGLPSIATACQAQGYETGYVGKWHLEWNRDPFVPKHRRLGFDYWAVNNCTHQYMDHFYCMDTPEEVHFKGYDAVVQTDLAIDYIQSHKNTPFCLFVSWGPPHDPYNKVPDEYKNRINPDDIALRPNVHDRTIVDPLLTRDEKSGATPKARQARRDIADNDDRLKQEYLHGYYAHTCALDDCIGKIRETLQESGLADDTILVFSSDHGDMLGSHRMLSKQNPLEESIRIPLLIEYPAMVSQNTRSEQLVAPVDIMPTLLGLAGLECPPVDGRDLSGCITDKTYDAQDAVLIMKMLQGGNPFISNAITPWRGVRTKRYTYTYLLDVGPWLLFDNQEDPYQLNNLINNPQYANIRDELDTRMRELMQAADDPGDTDAIAKYRLSMAPPIKE